MSYTNDIISCFYAMLHWDRTFFCPARDKCVLVKRCAGTFLINITCYLPSDECNSFFAQRKSVRLRNMISTLFRANRTMAGSSRRVRDRCDPLISIYYFIKTLGAAAYQLMATAFCLIVSFVETTLIKHSKMQKTSCPCRQGSGLDESDEKPVFSCRRQPIALSVCLKITYLSRTKVQPGIQLALLQMVAFFDISGSFWATSCNMLYLNFNGPL